MISTLNIRGRRNFLWDAQAVHRTLAHAADGEKLLWAVPDKTHLVVRHEHPIDWASSLGRNLHQATTIEEDNPITGEHVFYALIANPTIAKSRGAGKRGIVQPLPESEWHTWAHCKLSDALNIHTMGIAHLPAAVGKKKDRTVTHTRIIITGHATVRNADTLQALKEHGIGRGKAYGCGLLLTETQ